MKRSLLYDMAFSVFLVLSFSQVMASATQIPPQPTADIIQYRSRISCSHNRTNETGVRVLIATLPLGRSIGLSHALMKKPYNTSSLGEPSILSESPLSTFPGSRATPTRSIAPALSFPTYANLFPFKWIATQPKAHAPAVATITVGCPDRKPMKAPLT